jgi:hypothetical protein
MMKDTYSLQSLLQQVSVINRKYEDITAVTGERFNLFSIMHMETSEDWTHSTIITELLRSDGSHGQGNKFIKIFIDYVNQMVLQKGDGQERLALFDQYQAKAKKRIGKINDEYTLGGEIDIYVEDAEKCIIIENKIYAKGQRNQLLRYYNYGCRKKKCWLFYLTLEGRLPVDYETGNNNEVRNNVISISYKEHILAWLELCKREVADLPVIRESLTQYIYLLKKLTNQSTNKKMEGEIINAIIASPDSMSAALDVSNTIDKIYDPLLEVLKKEIKDKAEMLRFKTKDDKWGISTRVLAESYYYFYLPDTKYGVSIALGFDEKNCKDFSIGVYSDNDKLQPGSEPFIKLQREITERLEFIGECHIPCQKDYLYVCYKLNDESLVAWNKNDIWIGILNGQTGTKLVELVNTVYKNIKDLGI